MKKQILAACAAAALAATLCACGDTGAQVTSASTASTQTTSAQAQVTAEATGEVFTKVEEGFRVNTAQTEFYRVGDVGDGLAALEACLARLHPAAGDLHATFGDVTLAMTLSYTEGGDVILEATGAATDAHSIRFDTPLQTHFANGGVSLSAVGDRVVLTYTEPFRCVENYVFDADGIHSLLYSAGIGDADYNAPVLLLTGDGDTLRFVCWPKKFACGYARYDISSGRTRF